MSQICFKPKFINQTKHIDVCILLEEICCFITLSRCETKVSYGLFFEAKFLEEILRLSIKYNSINVMSNFSTSLITCRNLLGYLKNTIIDTNYYKFLTPFKKKKKFLALWKFYRNWVQNLLFSFYFWNLNMKLLFLAYNVILTKKKKKWRFIQI